MSVIANKFDIIILSLIKDRESLERTRSCVQSYIDTAIDVINKIIIVETNTEADYTWVDSLKANIQVIRPGVEFNYNKFFNIALEQCKAEYIFGPNNDLIIQPGCLQTILKEFQSNSNIHSISPIDRNWHRHTRMYLPHENKLYYGYEVSLHMFGCAWSARRSVFETIGYLDEQFYFFYQDNDYIECLKYNGLKHGVHTGARVSHGSGKSNNIADKKFKYEPDNMNIQGQIFARKWPNHFNPDIGVNWKPFREYKI